MEEESEGVSDSEMEFDEDSNSVVEFDEDSDRGHMTSFPLVWDPSGWI